MHLQEAVDPFDLFVRCLGFGPQLRIIRYEPAAPLHDRYTADDGGISDDERSLLTDMTLLINSFFGWDFNSCEALRQDGEWHPIDFANACPDSQVTSLHYHFPWLVAANLRWSIFCAGDQATDAADARLAALLRRARGGPASRERLAAYAAIARQRFDTDAFDEFCATHLGHLDEVLWEFFGTDSRQGRRAPEGRRPVPGARGRRSSPSCSGPGSSGGAPRTRRRRARA